MSGVRPRVLRGPAAAGHPAAEAWASGGRSRPLPERLEVWREKPTHDPASVYRLVFRDRSPGSVFVKRCRAEGAGAERLCYEEILPDLDLSSPVYHGSLAAADGTWWFFIEDVGRRRLSPRDPAHRALASRWLGRLHRLCTRHAAARRLPPAGASRYLAHLHSGRARIRRHLDNPALTAADLDVLSRVLAVQDRVEERWAAIERSCVGPFETLVHGDFRPKNVRVRDERSGPVLYALDWELAGWGPPMVDLAPARGAIGASQVEPEPYLAELGELAAGLDAERLSRLRDLGHLFRRLAAIDWDTTHLHFQDPECLVGPIASLHVLHRALGRALERAERWLA